MSKFFKMGESNKEYSPLYRLFMGEEVLVDDIRLTITEIKLFDGYPLWHGVRATDGEFQYDLCVLAIGKEFEVGSVITFLPIDPFTTVLQNMEVGYLIIVYVYDIE